MWEQYRKSLFGMQFVMWLIAAGVLLRTHRLFAAAVFFFVMQLGAIVGAMWGARLKNKLQGTRG
jgi:membrane protein implicated in regulation of membrane protease activity